MIVNEGGAMADVKLLEADSAVSVSDAKTRFSEIVDEVRTKPSHYVVIQKRDKPVAAIVDIGEFQRLREIEDRLISQELHEALKGPKYPLRKVLKDLDL